MVADPALIAPEEIVRLHCDAGDDELLLAAWLNALVSEMAARRMLFSRFELVLRDHRLDGRLAGERMSVARHHPAVEVKGATVTALRVAPVEGGWLAQTVVDV